MILLLLILMELKLTKIVISLVFGYSGVRLDKKISPLEYRIYQHYRIAHGLHRIAHGLRIALAFVLTFLIVRLLALPEGT